MPDPYEEVYDDNPDIYDNEELEKELEEEDTISPEEEAFMRGYNQATKKRKKKKKLHLPKN